jgi:hypothetical protein
MGQVYAYAVDSAFEGQIAWTTDGAAGHIMCALLTSNYTPNLSTDQYWGAIKANEIAAGGGYLTGGQALTSVSKSIVAANSWTNTRQQNFPYSVGQVIVPGGAQDTGIGYRCVEAGTTANAAASTITWPTTVGTTVTDGTVTWLAAGTSLITYSSAAVLWSGSTLNGVHYAVLYDAASGNTSTEPLILLLNLLANESDSDGNFQVTPDANSGWWTVAVA